MWLSVILAMLFTGAISLAISFPILRTRGVYMVLATFAFAEVVSGFAINLEFVGGAAGFPEFHHVYIEPGAFASYLRTGEFPEGTTIVKELVLLQEGHYEDGSRDEASGRGFFADRFAGIDMMVKDSARFADTSGWGFFNFGHHEPPYAETAAAAPNDACAYCHTANATHDMVFTTFYPILDRD